MTKIEQAGRPQRPSVEHCVVDGVRVVTVRGEIDHHVQGVYREALLPEDGESAPVRVVVDLSHVTFMDSSGINVFIAACKRVSAAQGWSAYRRRPGARLARAAHLRRRRDH
ncbi:STAS domain-containing protein [Streptomyces sp. NBC_00989]|uniref:STAS domain-containing protein n=1 Tax=Streptomyces sp. NBC_00989 TaxID=2903705 RepID=UPI003863E3A9